MAYSKSNIFTMKKMLLFIVMTVVLSCNMSDSSEELSGGYTFVHESKDYNFINGKHMIYPNVIEYKFNENFILACQEPNKILCKNLLGSNLWGDYFCYNSYMKDSLSEKYFKSRNEMLADSVIYKIFKNRKITFENSLDDIKKGEEIADSIIRNEPIHKKIFSLKKVYWIIQIKGDILLGPFNKQEYLLKRKKNRVEEDLKLKN
jgi:hypothetical protein